MLEVAVDRAHESDDELDDLADLVEIVEAMLAARPDITRIRVASGGRVVELELATGQHAAPVPGSGPDADPTPGQGRHRR